MKKHLLWLFVTLLAAPVSLFAAEAASPTWHAQTIWEALGYMLLFAVVGIAAAIAGYTDQSLG
ncbi:MAG: hypothetical protein EXS18_07205 [Verrucomicrobiae bacterium]|nr:hypothetical protein [Verrucomicrobiae bacterium]